VTRVWVAWLVAAAVSFAALEGYALYTPRPGDTLSENLRRWLGIAPPRPWRHVGAVGFVAALVGFVAWFGPHIVLGWP
jgi:hypothetical protein